GGGVRGGSGRRRKWLSGWTPPPAAMFKVPLPRMLPNSAVPDILATPLLPDTLKNSAVPPASTLSVPPETLVPELGAPEIRPPEEMFSTPPDSTRVLLVIAPSTSSVPPLDTSR